MAGLLPPPWRVAPPELGVSSATFAAPRTLRVLVDRFSAPERAFVQRVLNDPRGWAAYGFSFLFVDSDADADVTLRLTSAAEMEAWYPQTHLRGLSVTDCTRDKPRIFLHAHNWDQPPAASTYPHDAAGVRAYRTYVVLHEMGHALGLGHATCPGPGAPAPVLVQQSKGCGACVRDPWVVKILRASGRKHSSRLPPSPRRRSAASGSRSRSTSKKTKSKKSPRAAQRARRADQAEKADQAHKAHQADPGRVRS